MSDTPVGFEKVYRDLFYDQDGLVLPAVAFAVAAVAGIAMAFHTLSIAGHFDMLQYGVGIAVITVGYGAAAGSRVRTNARFRKLEARIAEIESKDRK